MTIFHAAAAAKLPLSFPGLRQEPLHLSLMFALRSYSSIVNSTNCSQRPFKSKQSDLATHLLKTLLGALGPPRGKSHSSLWPTRSYVI